MSIFGAPPVDGLGNAGGFKLMVEDRGNLGLDDAADRRPTTWSPQGNDTPGLEGVFTSLRANTPWLYLDIDRVKAKSMGVRVGDVFDTLQVYLGSLYVNNFNEFGRSWQVNVQADAQFRTQIDDVMQLKVRNAAGQDGAAGHAGRRPRHQRPGDGHALQHVSGRGDQRQRRPPGTSSGEAIDLMEELADDELPPAMGYEWTELTYMQILAGSTAMTVFALAVVLVFLVLAAQYESWSLPLAVILVVPMCLLCSIAGVALARHGRQHLHADRLRGAGGPGQQERHSDRRVRPAAARRGRGRGARPRSRPAGCGCGRS